MTRKKPTSTKQKKAELQLHRAMKRDVNSDNSAHVGTTSQKPSKPSRSHPNLHRKIESKSLQSSFAKISVEYLERSKLLASTLPLERPIPSERLLFPEECKSTTGQNLKILKRPKWGHDMTKKQVESNEEALFSRWLIETDTILDGVQSHDTASVKDSDDYDQEAYDSAVTHENSRGIVSLPRYYERNIEVWRQLWRVVEISQIYLILLDCRCPLLHLPPSLHTFLLGFGSARKSILVLTKTDVTGPTYSNAWAVYLRSHYSDMIVVEVEDNTVDGDSTARYPRLSSNARKDLIDALRKAHEELCTPPIRLKKQEDKLRKWRPLVPETINWDACFSGQPVSARAESANSEKDKDIKYLTIGLIGQPNVGKSSLLNALFGLHKVKASHTPGKTKHFQTLFLTPELRLVDCPGLVFPTHHCLELQVLAGVIPISQVSTIASCISYALQYIPLERIFSLQHPSLSEPPETDKRTWRGGMREQKRSSNSPVWTAMDVLVSYATLKGWVTAKAGRPDINRAGNAMLRSLARAQIRWAFLPPDFRLDTICEIQRDKGIWLPSETKEEEDSASEASEETLLDIQASLDLNDDSESDDYQETVTPQYGKYELLGEDKLDHDENSEQEQ